MRIDPQFIDHVAGEALEAFGAPGVSVAVFENGQIVSHACGVADLGTGEQLTPEHTFCVASPTKGFTALAVALLCEDGAIAPDDPVTGIVPDLCPRAPERRPAVTVRHLLSHQSGFGWHDPLWYNSEWDRSEVIRKAWLAGPLPDPRPRFQYCNVTFMLAGEIAARTSGMPYEKFVRSRILEPLGLRSAHFCGEPRAGQAPLASPHLAPDGPRPIAPPDVSKANPACGLRISASDLVRWGAVFCDAAGTGLPPRAIESVGRPQVPVGPGEGSRFYSLFGQPDWLEYGFGWFLRRYRGHRAMLHTGRLPGSGTHIAVLPDARFAVAVMTNLTLACLAESVAMAVLDRFTGGPRTDWLSYYRQVSAELSAGAAPVPRTGAGGHGPERSGRYRDDAYGLIEIGQRGGGLEFRWANYRGELVGRDASSCYLANLGCSLLADGEIVEFTGDGNALRFLGRRFERLRSASREGKPARRRIVRQEMSAAGAAVRLGP